MFHLQCINNVYVASEKEHTRKYTPEIAEIISKRKRQR